MIDTSFELNLIKENAVNSHVWVNTKKIYDLVGIGKGIIKTMGRIKIIFKYKESAFKILPNNFPIPQNGILGVNFLQIIMQPYHSRIYCLT